jgi:hypothetical protein
MIEQFKLTWKDVFNSNNQKFFWATIYTLLPAVYQSGYKYFEWNGSVYRLLIAKDGKLDFEKTSVLAENLDKNVSLLLHSTLTQEQKQKYIEDGGEHCPFCGSEDMGWDNRIQLDDVPGKAYQIIFCSDCEGQWIDIYSLTDIQIE